MSTYKISRKSEAKNQSAAAARSWPKKITNKRRQILKFFLISETDIEIKNVNISNKRKALAKASSSINSEELLAPK